MRAACFRRFLLCLAAWFVGGIGVEASAGESGHHFFQNFSPRDYGARSQNWAATQDRQGIMYFGNQGVVLQYDGVSWRKIPINQVTDVVRGLDADPVSGTVFVGGLNELGYLAAGADSEMRFVSLLDRLPAGDRDFRSVHRVFATPQGVFLAAEKQLMRWRDGAFRVWKLPAVRLVRWQWVQGHLYAQEPSIGLLRLDGEEFIPVSADPLLRKVIVMTMVADADGAVTLGTLYGNSGAGLYQIVEADPMHGLTARAEPVPRLEGECWSAYAFGDDLLVADTIGVLRLDGGGQVTRIYNGGFSGAILLGSRVQPERVFMGWRSELRTLRHDAAQDR